MDFEKQTKIEDIVDKVIFKFADDLLSKFSPNNDGQNDLIDNKKNNCFISELGEEFMFYSTFVRSFDSSFGNILQNIGNKIGELSYTVGKKIDSFILPEQIQLISNLMDYYKNNIKPELLHYNNQNVILPRDITSFKREHKIDNYFYDEISKTYYIIELKAGGDLDNKKSKAEKIAMLTEYFLLKNKIIDKKDETVEIYFATAYNKFGEGNVWKQRYVKQFFSEDELLIGKDYWNFICKNKYGFEIISNQYKKSSRYIKDSLIKIKETYF